MANTINTKTLKRMAYRPKVYKHKYDATQEYVNLQPAGLEVVQNGYYYPNEGEAFNSVHVNVPTVIKPTVSISLTPETNYYQKERDKLKEITIALNVLKGSSPVSLVRIKINNTSVKEFTENVSEGGPFVYTHYFTSLQTTDFLISVEVFDSENRMVVMNKDVKFTFNGYYGVIDDGVDPESTDVLKSLIPVMKGTRDLLFSSINSEYGKIVYAYPVNQGELISIRDPIHMINYKESFTKRTVQIGECNYYVYFLTNSANLDDVQILFN